MIKDDEIKRMAEEFKLSPHDLQRDYVHGLLLHGMSQRPYLRDTLLLKGGNALRKAYIPSTRFSKDETDAEANRLLQMSDYHGFLKSRIPADFLNEILVPFQLSINDVQIEIVKVDTDLSKEIHYHEHSYAYVVCLGKKYKTEDLRNARAFLGDSWFPVQAGDVVKIPPKTPHGFTVDEGGILVFLSVQAPPIEREGKDDYHKVGV